MRFLPSVIVLACVIPGFGQITSTQQKALNSYVDYANQSADNVSSVVSSIVTHYRALTSEKSWRDPKYVCPIQLEDYYLNQANTLSKNLGATLTTPLNSKLKELQAAIGKVESTCKTLDTYYKLEDYKQDNFERGKALINQLQILIVEYKVRQNALQTELEAAYKKLTVSSPQGAYRKADDLMRQQINRERSFIDSWTLNLDEGTHTGWPVDKLEKSILDTDAQLASLQKTNPPLKYPASSMWPSFVEAVGSVLEIKRNGLNGYNFDAKKSDEHSNDVYLNLINYFNGGLVSDYNAFLNFSERDGYYGLSMIKYFPVFEIRSQIKSVDVEVKPFKDIPRVPVSIAAQKTTLPGAVFESLKRYVEFIDETWRQTHNLQTTLVSFNSTASYYKTFDSFERHGVMTFEYKKYEVPLAQFQKTVTDSKMLSPAIAKSLNDQAEVLLNILKELDDLSASIQIEVSERRYEKDRLNKIYTILERQKLLFDLWDDKKELMYNDVRKIFDAYPQPLSGSWQVSGKALRQLTDLDRDAVFKARAYYKGDSSIRISTSAIDETLRNVISKEYDNMKGIEKYGRFNGLCPYTPYEDLPKTSKSLSEVLNPLKPAGNKTRYDHPYYRIVYHYNDIVDDYNKFSELSKGAFHLPTVHQPELFVVKYPDPKKADQTTAQPVAQRDPPKVETPVKQDPPVEAKKQETKQETKTENLPVAQTKVLHDTVYVQKRDTIYLTEPNENLRSMEGYAANNMILLLDVSGSMNTPEKLPVLKQSVLSMLSMMRPEDNISIIAFSGKPKVLLESTSFKEEEKIRKAINGLKSSGKTDGNSALKLAYKVADESYIRGGNNRIILATDGQFATNQESNDLIDKFSKQDIFLSIFNFGKGAGASKELERLSTLGKGNYEYVSKENVELKLIREAKAKRKK